MLFLIGLLCLASAESFLDAANALLKKGKLKDALAQYDLAIAEAPDYLTFFRRGATHLSLGRTSAALEDFDKALELRPGFEGALAQRGRLRLKQGQWAAATADLGSLPAEAKLVAEISVAKEAAEIAASASESKDWQACINEAGTAISAAPMDANLRSLRANCRIEAGLVQEAITDLTHLVQLRPSQTEPYLTITNLLFFSMDDSVRALDFVKKCLHYDPDAKDCKALFRKLKALNKDIGAARTSLDRRMWTSTGRSIIADSGVLAKVEQMTNELVGSGLLGKDAPKYLIVRIKEYVCEAFTEAKAAKKAQPYCDDVLVANPRSLYGLLSKAARLIEEEEYDDAIETLNFANEVSEGKNAKVKERLQEAHTLLKRSKSKDYYKILGVERNANSNEIKSAYRKKTRQYHPDKYRGDLNADQVQRKMAEINEAYELLMNPELRARFDRGDDPNDHESPRNPFGGGGNPFVFQQGGSPFFFHDDGGAYGQHSGFEFKFNFGG